MYLFVLLNEGNIATRQWQVPSEHSSSCLPGTWGRSTDFLFKYCDSLFECLSSSFHIRGYWLNKPLSGSILPSLLTALLLLRTSPVPSKYFLLWWPHFLFLSKHGTQLKENRHSYFESLDGGRGSIKKKKTLPRTAKKRSGVNFFLSTPFGVCGHGLACTEDLEYASLNESSGPGTLWARQILSNKKAIRF